jgi:putative colanic acid biosysnthesis UDP-glucose lipid carrier transferase
MSAQFSRSASRTAVAPLSAQQAFPAEQAERLQTIWHAGLRRCFDTVLAALLLLPAAPILLAAALLIKLESPGQAFIRQRRYGLHRKEFSILKLRTMRAVEDGDQVVQCQVNDPRVTSVGSILRRTSIDELPQLLNVLRGEMSLVGPRPHPTTLDDHFEGHIPGYFLRFSVRPGITGLAQVQGHRGPIRSLEAMQMRISADVSYVRMRSVLLDVKILLATMRLALWRGAAS